MRAAGSIDITDGPPAAEVALATALRRAEWQPALFGPLDRSRLLQCEASWPLDRIRIRVLRNHAIEPVVSAASPFAAWNGFAFEWALGPYEDALMSVESADTADDDVVLVWLDLSRLTGLAPHEVAPWLVARMRALRAHCVAPIVVAAWPLAHASRTEIQSANLPGVHIADLDALATMLGERWLDARTQVLAGTRLSNRACLFLARELACRWLPACVRAPVKAVVVDLDDTLYAGVLGEDGASGLTLTAGHHALQTYLASLAAHGMLLAIVSRNDANDVDSLFATRTDFPLRREHFTVIEATWSGKAAALERVAAHLRIGVDSMVFVDDNVGELASVAAAVPAVTVQAAEGAATQAALAGVAGVWRWRESAEDRLRARDIALSHTRREMSLGVSLAAYVRELDIRLRYRLGFDADIARAAELACKTNQFNLALRRSSAAHIASRRDAHPRNVVTITLADRLSDSGTVAALVAHLDRAVLHIEEIVVSCRALGRRIEGAMLAHALRLLAEGRDVRTLRFDVARGQRNAPALDWLATFAGSANVVPAGTATSVEVPLAAITGAVAQAMQLPLAIACDMPEISPSTAKCRPERGSPPQRTVRSSTR